MIPFYLFLYFTLFLLKTFIEFPVSYTVFTDYLYLTAKQGIFVLAYSLFFSIFIGAAYLSLKNNFSLIGSLKYARFTLKNFIFLAGALIVYSLSLFLMATYMKGLFASFSYGYIFAALLIELIFILISSLSLGFVMKNTLSTSFGYKRYLAIVSLSLVYYFATGFINKLVFLVPNSFFQIILYLVIYFLIVYPIIAIILAYIFLEDKDKNKLKLKK